MEEYDLIFYKDFVNANEIQYKDITEMNLKQLVIYKKELLKLGNDDPNILTKDQDKKYKKLMEEVRKENLEL